MEALAPYYFSGRRVPPALVLDYARSTDAELGHCMSVLRAALEPRPQTGTASSTYRV